jgi:hypothetical protein
MRPKGLILDGASRPPRSTHNRRELIALGAMAGLASRSLASAQPVRPAARLETRLFNLKDGLSPGQGQDLIDRFKARASAAAPGGFLIGRNSIPDPFATRFEWIYMAQFDDVGALSSSPAFQAFAAAREDLARGCRNQAQCDLDGPLPARFAEAAGVKVRHTVMFSFKPDATPEDRARNVAAIRQMGRMPMVQAYRVEPNTSAVTGPDELEWQVIGDFASAADYQAYSRAPMHLAIRQDFTAHVSRVAFLDVAL